MLVLNAEPAKRPHAAVTVDTQPSRRSTCTLRLSPDMHQWQKCSQLLLAMR
jgi:hypothetical protein